ncbi:MAG: hypothetical protein ABI607_07450 [Betaproteobacteria bacterium]
MARIGSGIMVAALTLLAASGVAAEQAVVVQGALCRGEEPFWQLEASRTTALFNRLATKGNREVIFRGAPQAFMFITPAAIVWRGDSTHLPRETLVVTLREEACRSTMADGPPLPWRAMLSLKTGEAMTGCCTVLAGYDVKISPVADATKKSPEDWARALPDMLPAINLCLGSDDANTRSIAKAGPAGNGLATVRMMQATGKAIDCETELSGKGTLKLAAVNPADPPLAGAGNPLFYPARESSPMVRCGKLERVIGRNGVLLGYLHYDPC